MDEKVAKTPRPHMLDADEVAGGLGLATRIGTQLGKARLQRVENAVENAFACRIDVVAKGRKRVAHVRYIEVAALGDPGGKEVLVGDEVAALALNELDRLCVILHEAGQILLGEVARLQAGNLGLGEEFVEDESQNVVLIFVGLDLRAHFVGGLPYLGSQLLLVHLRPFASCVSIRRVPISVAKRFTPVGVAERLWPLTPCLSACLPILLSHCGFQRSACRSYGVCVI